MLNKINSTDLSIKHNEYISAFIAHLKNHNIPLTSVAIPQKRGYFLIIAVDGSIPKNFTSASSDI